MLVFAAKHQKLAALVQSCGMSYSLSVTHLHQVRHGILTHSHSGDIAVVVDQAPLMTRKIKSEDMIVNFICILIEPSEGIYLVVAAIRHRGVDETRGSRA